MKWLAKPESLKPKYFEIKEDPIAGFYLYVFEENKCIKDYLQDTFEIAVECALEDYGVPKTTWKKMEDESYRCRVCGLKQSFKPWGEDGKTPAFEICGCCGVDFGYQDCTPEYVKKFRTEWIKKGGKWVIPDEKPLNWSWEEQMKHIAREYL